MNKLPRKILVSTKLAVLVGLAASQIGVQDRCQINEEFMRAIENRLRIYTSNPGGGARDVFVSNLSFIDGVTKTNILSEEAALIDEAVRDGMKLAAQSNPNIKINDPDHTLANTTANVIKLSRIYFDPNLTLQEKYEKAAAEMLKPFAVDILVTGVIVDTGTRIQVQTMGVSRPDKTVKSRNISYNNRDELFTRVNQTLTLTRKAHEEIQKAVKEILEN